MSAPSMRPLLLLAAAALAGCFVPREPAAQEDRACTRCHGDAAREGDAALKAAPPTDTKGNTDVSYPGVGAHARHLAASDTHGAVACAECHLVPADSGDALHNDGTTQVRFGPVGTRDGGTSPTWDARTQRCTDSCHGASSVAWTRPRPASETCGSCHGVPPPAPHPQAGACETCHAQVLSGPKTFRAPALHVDGVVQVGEPPCGACHGEGDAGVPPRALDGGTSVTNRGVGAHAAHLSGGAWGKPVPCETCHVVPEKAATPSHPNGGPAEVLAAVGYSPVTTTCTNGCHGGTSPAWTTEAAALGCASCHGAPPPAPHPQVAQCVLCHATAARDGGVADRAAHVNGVEEVQVPTSCSGCHGSTANPAPPQDLEGGSATTGRGVGAHQAHLVGRGLSRLVACEECHAVPATVTAPGHLDGVTQVRFTGVATAWGAAPAWSPSALTCANVACHDAKAYTPATTAGGTATTPTWTQVDGSQRGCGACHGMPPPAPHPTSPICIACHDNAATDGGFVRPELHINGRLEFALP